jgi:hypothetical protein
LVFSPFFSPSTTRPLWCSWSYFSLQIRLVSNLDAWSDFLDISKKAFNSLPLYRVQKLKRYSWNVKLLKEYLMNHLTPLPYYLISLLVYLLYGVGSTTYIYFIIYCITMKLVLSHVCILSFIVLLWSWFDYLYLFYHLLHSYKVAMPPISLSLCIFILAFAFLQSGYAADIPIICIIILSC